MKNYGWWVTIAGIGMMSHNVYSLVVFVINWAMMTIVLINTEESEGRSWKAFVDALAITNHTREESELL